MIEYRPEDNKFQEKLGDGERRVPFELAMVGLVSLSFNLLNTQ